MTPQLPGMPPQLLTESRASMAQPSPSRPFRPSAAVVARFEAKIVRTEGCWWWTGAVASGHGHGCFAEYHDTVTGAHRFALELELGRRLGGGEVAAHGCDEPLCVRVGPEHVHPSTPADNMHDMVVRGRRRGPWVLDTRGPAGRSRAIRDAVKAAVASGGDVAAAVEEAAVTGDPLRDQLLLPL